MQSTRLGLALLLRQECDSAARCMAAWLGADRSLASVGSRLTRRCRLVVRAFSAWLREGGPQYRTRARIVLTVQRAREVAASSLHEFLKQEGWPDREAAGLIEEFFLGHEHAEDLVRPLPTHGRAEDANPSTP